jgi:hypothetical protein
MAIMLTFAKEAVASNHVAVKVFKSWSVTHTKGKSCRLENFTRLKNTASLQSRKKHYDTSELKPVEIYLIFVARFREFPVAINARWSLEKPQKSEYYFGKTFFSVDKAPPHIFKRRYKPYTFAFLTSGELDALVIDMKKGLWGQISGQLFDIYNQEFTFESTVDLRGFTKAWNTYEECIQNDGFK